MSALLPLLASRGLTDTPSRSHRQAPVVALIVYSAVKHTRQAEIGPGTTTRVGCLLSPSLMSTTLLPSSSQTPQKQSSCCLMQRCIWSSARHPVQTPIPSIRCDLMGHRPPLTDHHPCDNTPWGVVGWGGSGSGAAAAVGGLDRNCCVAL